MIVAYGRNVSAEFIAEVRAICRRINWTDDHVNWLMACIAFESARTFSPSIKSPVSSATGLIQFMDATARHLGTTTDALAKMTAVEQLKYVELYFKPYASKIKSIDDMYMAILWPSAIGQHPDSILWNKDSRFYSPNKALDKKSLGFISKSMAADQVKKLLKLGLTSRYTSELKTEDQQPVKYFTLFQALKQGYALTHAADSGDCFCIRNLRWDHAARHGETRGSSQDGC